MSLAETDAATPVPIDNGPCPIDLLRQALCLLDRAGRTSSGDFLQHVIDMVEEERWRTAGVHAPHRIVQ